MPVKNRVESDKRRKESCPSSPKIKALNDEIRLKGINTKNIARLLVYNLWSNSAGFRNPNASPSRTSIMPAKASEPAAMALAKESFAKVEAFNREQTE